MNRLANDRNMNHRAWQWLLVMIVALAAHHRTDARADDFPTPVNTEPDGAAPVMSADQAAATMKVPAGFSVGVFAGEPDVQNPIDMAWDSAGRLWVAENYTYSDRSERFDLSLRDRVLMFTDDDGDGVSDSRTVFTDNVQMLTSVEVGLGGVWLMCPTNRPRSSWTASKSPRPTITTLPTACGSVPTVGCTVAAEVLVPVASERPEHPTNNASDWREAFGDTIP